MRSRIWIILVLAFFFTLNNSSFALEWTGIGTPEFSRIYVEQNKSHWCWAATIQMMLNYYGIDVTQEQIVRRSYGTDKDGKLPDWTADFELMSSNLNWYAKENGDKYRISIESGPGAPAPNQLLQEMKNNRPVLIAYENGELRHAVVVTGVGYKEVNGSPEIDSIIVRDPWPKTGRREYVGSKLAPKIRNYWFLKVQNVRSGPATLSADNKSTAGDLSGKTAGN